MIIPKEVKIILDKLQEAGFEAYAVGGCVRDLLLGRKPKDWDVATNALPEQVQAVFPDSFYENKFGTVSVKVASDKCPVISEKDSSLCSRGVYTERSERAQNDENESIDFVEVTTYRVDEKYTDKRHPDAVSFTPNLKEDLARRDFTINAMALGIGIKNHESRIKENKIKTLPRNSLFIIHDSVLIDPFGGQEDLKNGVIRAVGQADKRFDEDALRMLRAVRFAVELTPFRGHPEEFNDEGSKKDSSAEFTPCFDTGPQNDKKIKNRQSVEQVPQRNVKQGFIGSHPEERSDEGAPANAVSHTREIPPPQMRGRNDKNSRQFIIEPKTKTAIKKNAAWLRAIAKERVRDEFVKIIMSDSPHEGILLLHELGLLEFIIPELEKGFGVAQNKHHIYSIFEHGIFSLKFAVHPVKSRVAGTAEQLFNGARKKSDLVVRLAALLHDVAKPQAKRGEGPDATFYNHDIMGARLAARILERLRFDNETIERVANLVRHHMFVYDVGAVTPAGVRRLLVRVGPENMEDLIALRVADRLGSGVPKAQPYRLRHFQYMVERVQQDPISVKALKVNGNDLMGALGIKPGPKIGAILDVLLAEVIEDPKKNDKDILLERAKQLDQEDLAQLRQMAKARIEEEKEEEDKVIKGRYWV